MARNLYSLLRSMVEGTDAHLSDDRLASLFTRELRLNERWTAKLHLKRCASCRERQQQLEGPRAEQVLQLYTDFVSSVDPKLDTRPRAVFASWLDQQTSHAQTAAPRWWRFTLTDFSLSSAVSAVMACLTVGVAVGLSAFWSQRAPSLSANNFLAHAETSQMPAAADRFKVAHQVFQIKTGSRKIERSVYWDLQGKRRPRAVQLTRSTEELRSELGRAGVDWDQPISASAYQDWHDRQHLRSDRVARTGLHLLTLTTTVPDGAVSEESLTVRDSDFHPVKRTIDLRDSGPIEIAEVDFKILPWSDVEPGAFASVDEARAAVEPPFHSATPSVSLSVPRLPSPDQLDETELAARLILNKLHADTDEQIEMHRSQQGIELDGLVQTNERKQELVSQLIAVPRLKVSIHSVADLAETPVSNTDAVTIESSQLPDNKSALETYLASHGHTTTSINITEQRLFAEALAVSQEARAIDDLERRFHSAKGLPVVASATLAELLYSHHERLEAALRRERQILADTQPGLASDSISSAAKHLSLAESAARNLALVKELTQTNAAPDRAAGPIFAEISDTVSSLAAAAHDAYTQSESPAAASVNTSEKR